MTNPDVAREALERMAAQFNSICNAYKGFLPDIDEPDVRTRLKHIADATKAFDAAHDAALGAGTKSAPVWQYERLVSGEWTTEFSFVKPDLEPDEIRKIKEPPVPETKAGESGRELPPAIGSFFNEDPRKVTVIFREPLTAEDHLEIMERILATPTPRGEPTREAVARIIDPNAFKALPRDNDIWATHYADRRTLALMKADEVCVLYAQPATREAGQ